MTDIRPALPAPARFAVPAGLGFLIGASFLVPIGTRAGVTLGHVVLVALLPVTLTASWKLRTTRYLFGAEALWLITSVVTDYLHGVGLHDSYLTFVRPVAIFVTYCGFLWLFKMGRRHVVAGVGGFFCGVIVSSATYQAGNFALDPWKYGVGDPVTLALVGCAGWALLRHRTALATELVGVALMTNLLLGFRSEMGVVLVAAAVAGVAGTRRARDHRWAIKLGLLVAVVLAVGYPLYGALASSGHLGVEQQYKWERQSQVTGGALIGARPEFVSASIIISQSPILGRGTGFSVDLGTQARFLERLNQLGITVGPDQTQFFFGQGVYLHSCIFQTWAESGILSLPAMLLPWALLLRAAGRAVRVGSRPMALIFAVLAAQFTWDLLFSPWPRLAPSMLGVATAGAVVYLSRTRPEPVERAVPAVPVLT